MKEAIAPKLHHIETDIHTRLINPYAKLGKYKLWSQFNKVSLNFSLYTLFNCRSKKKERKKEKKEPYQCASLIMIDD